MGFIWLAAVAAVLLGVVWWAFPTVARIAGFLIALDSLLSIALFPAQALPHRLWWLLLGILVWLAGHWAWAAKHGVWASSIALRIFRIPGLRRVLPRSARISPTG
ncbi:hypothetical protein [Nocardia transvalensis]|uniref:hypothetical protein n=1 Tax=Nocardia transvalensis TaxID=37333 RepID=UPI0018953915|nr:hypothetical protein [Nocardia transvalensis]MBF6328444.1 hypothetical protein [Nocardia transvalensis]